MATISFSVYLSEGYFVLKGIKDFICPLSKISLTKGILRY